MVEPAASSILSPVATTVPPTPSVLETSMLPALTVRPESPPSRKTRPPWLRTERAAITPSLLTTFSISASTALEVRMTVPPSA